MKKIDEKYFHLDNETRITKPEDLLGPGEKVLWKGKPKKSAYVLGRSISLMPIAIIWGLIDFTILGVALSQDNIPSVVYLFLIGFFALHLMPVWIWLSKIIRFILMAKR